MGFEVEGNPSKNRVICLVDVDCFEVQVYDKIFQEFISFPRVVANKGNYQRGGGRIVAVSYEARAAGVKRAMNVNQAIQCCPGLKIITKKNIRGKPDTKTPRHASWNIFDQVRAFFGATNVALEYSSSDEFYLDLTKLVDYRIQNKEQYLVQPKSNFHLEGGTRKFRGPEILYRLNKVYPKNYRKYEKEERLIYGGMIAQELCEFIYDSIGYRISAGISSNKLMAKLACPVHKPGGVTILPRAGLDRITWRIPIEDIPGLGGLCGQKIKNNFNIKTMKDLRQITQQQLRQIFDAENSSRFYDLGQGLCDDAVANKIMKDEVSCGKNRIGYAFGEKLLNHLVNLSGEMMERLEEEQIRNGRTTQFLQIKCEYWKEGVGSVSFTIDISQLGTEQQVAERCYALLASDPRTEKFSIKNLKLIAKNFN